MRPPAEVSRRHVLSPEFQQIEQRMEREIMQLFNETLDDSTLLRRDTVLAELILKVGRVFVRLSNHHRGKKVDFAFQFWKLSNIKII